LRIDMIDGSGAAISRMLITACTADENTAAAASNENGREVLLERVRGLVWSVRLVSFWPCHARAKVALGTRFRAVSSLQMDQNAHGESERAHLALLSECIYIYIVEVLSLALSACLLFSAIRSINIQRFNLAPQPLSHRTFGKHRKQIAAEWRRFGLSPHTLATRLAYL
jgi:hypothetical protein